LHKVCTKIQTFAENPWYDWVLIPYVSRSLQVGKSIGMTSP